MSRETNDRVFVSARWDEGAGSWFVESSSYPGLRADASSLDLLAQQVREALRAANGTDRGGGELVMQATWPA